MTAKDTIGDLAYEGACTYILLCRAASRNQSLLRFSSRKNHQWLHQRGRGRAVVKGIPLSPACCTRKRSLSTNSSNHPAVNVFKFIRPTWKNLSVSTGHASFKTIMHFCIAARKEVFGLNTDRSAFVICVSKYAIRLFGPVHMQKPTVLHLKRAATRKKANYTVSINSKSTQSRIKIISESIQNQPRINPESIQYRPRTSGDPPWGIPLGDPPGGPPPWGTPRGTPWGPPPPRDPSAL